MGNRIYFFQPLPGADSDVPHELVLSVSDLLKASGFDLRMADEDGWVFQGVKFGIREKGITYYTQSRMAMESVMPVGFTSEERVNLINCMLNTIHPTEELLLIDPYIFPEKHDDDYIETIEEIVKDEIVGLSSVVVVTKHKRNEGIEQQFVQMIRKINQKVEYKPFYSEEFHDRFWIADRSRGLFVGTSLNGIGKKFAIADYLREDDVKAICSRFQEMTDSSDMKSAPPPEPFQGK